MGFRLKTESVMEFESKEDLKKVIAMMPWTPDQKVEFFKTGEHEEEDEAEFDFGTVDTTHKFTLEED